MKCFKIRKVAGVRAISKDSVPAFSDSDRQLPLGNKLGWWCHHLGTSPTSTCHSQPRSAALLIYSLALQHSSKRSSQPILQESVKFTCGIHQLSAYIPMSFHICEYSLSRGVAPNPPLWDNWAQAYSAFCSNSVQMDMFLFPPLFTDSLTVKGDVFFRHRRNT